jgi:hypothetical protein
MLVFVAFCSWIVFLDDVQGDPQFHRVGPAAAQRLDERLVDILRLLRPFKYQPSSSSSSSSSFESGSLHAGAAEQQPPMSMWSAAAAPHQSFAASNHSFASAASSSPRPAGSPSSSLVPAGTIALDERSAALLQSTLDAQRADLARQARVQMQCIYMRTRSCKYLLCHHSKFRVKRERKLSPYRGNNQSQRPDVQALCIPFQSTLHPHQADDIRRLWSQHARTTHAARHWLTTQQQQRQNAQDEFNRQLDAQRAAFERQRDALMRDCAHLRTANEHLSDQYLQLVSSASLAAARAIEVGAQNAADRSGDFGQFNGDSVEFSVNDEDGFANLDESMRSRSNRTGGGAHTSAAAAAVSAASLNAAIANAKAADAQREVDRMRIECDEVRVAAADKCAALEGDCERVVLWLTQARI